MSDTLLPNDGRMKPIIIIPPETISEADIKELRDNGLCVVIAKNPAAVKFLDPIPAMIGRSKIEDAAIRLSAKILDKETFRDTANGYLASLSRKDIATLFIECVTKGTPLDAEMAQQKRFEERNYNDEHLAEVRKIAREDARAEAAARKAAKASKKP